MIEGGALFRWAHFVLLSLVAGAFFVNWLLVATAQARPPLESRVLLAAMLVLAVVCLAGLIATEAFATTDGEVDTGLLRQFLFGTWVGKVAVARATLILAAAAVCLLVPSSVGAKLTFALVVAALAILPAGGHAISGDPLVVSLLSHSLHLVAAGLWFGGLVVLCIYAFRGRLTLASTKTTGFLLERFSPFALAFMTALVATGVALAVLQIGRPAALLGTPYGVLILVKTLLFLAPALAIAGHLRFVYLKSAAPDHNPWRALWAEAGLAACVVLTAAVIAQSVPAKHDAIEWWLNFRLAPEVTWRTPSVPIRVVVSLVVASAAIALLLWLMRRGAVSWRGLAPLAVIGAGALVVAGVNVSVEAYPTTYSRSTSIFNAQSVVTGRHLFQKTCAPCHGMSGHGDGPAMPPGAVPANNPGLADLTAPHTSDHTVGDLFWWISKGKPGTVMPGWSSVYTADERWKLIDYLRVLSSGYQARLLEGEVIPNQPWLPSIDFSYQMDNGDLGSLKEFRERAAVLLAIVRDAGQLDRIRYLLENAEKLAGAGLEVIVLATPEVAAEVRKLVPAGTRRPTVVTQGVEDAVFAWSEYRRSLKDPDTKDERQTVPLMEFLIDRFGYVRARWRSDEGRFADASNLIGAVRMLATEPRLLPSPDEHAH